MTKVKYIVKMTAPCECCGKESYGFRGNFSSEEDARLWIVKAKISKDYQPEILPITLDKNYNDKVLFKCEKQQNFSVN